MIELRNIVKTYHRKKQRITALNGVDLSVDRGDIFGVIGYSGAGKSTLIRLINYLERPTEGSVVIDGQDLAGCSPAELRGVKRQIGMIFQHFNLLESRSVAHNIAMPLILAGRPKSEIEPRVAELLSFVGLADKGSSYPNELSGGQKQRVGIARALASNPKILLCDEATSALDPETTRSILALLRKINDELQITIVLITHEMAVIQEICNKVAVMDGGKIVETGPTLEVFLHPEHQTSRNFVQTVVSSDLPPEDFAEYSNGGCVYQLEILGDAWSESFLHTLSQKFALDLRIVKANTVTIQQSKVLILTVRIAGTAEQHTAGIDYLRSVGINVQEALAHV